MTLRAAFVVSLLGAAGDAGATPLWHDTVGDGEVTDGQANDVVASDLGVFVGGFVAVDGSELLLRAYAPRTGRVLWEQRGGPADAVSELGRLARLDDRLFGTVFASRGNQSTSFDWVVRAWDAGTGAVLWTDDHDSGEHDGASEIVAAAGRVFASGTLSSASDRSAFAIRAYDAATGALLWQDQVGGGERFDRATSVAADGARAYAGGAIDALPRVRAYDAASGALLWQQDVAPWGDVDAVAVAGDRVVVAGRHAGGLVVRAYDGATGALAWQRDEPPFGADAARNPVVSVDATADAGAAFVAVQHARDVASIVRSYAMPSGATRWTVQSDVARDLGLAGGRLLGTGSRIGRALDAASGASQWSSERRDDGSALAIAAHGPLVFVAGVAGSGFGTFHVTAYDTRVLALRPIVRSGVRLPFRH